MIGYGASSFVLGSSSLLSKLHQLPKPEIVFIANGHPYPIYRKGVANPTSSISLSDVLYFLNFLIILLYINVVTKNLFYSVSFFAYLASFKICVWG